MHSELLSQLDIGPQTDIVSSIKILESPDLPSRIETCLEKALTQLVKDRVKQVIVVSLE